MRPDSVTREPAVQDAAAPVHSDTAQSAAGRSASDQSSFDQSVACSFCLRPPSQVQTMVAGPGVFICNECVELSAVIIATKSQNRDAVAGWEQELSDEDLLAHLPRVAAAGEQAERHLASWVQKARGRGITWTRIGAALGMTRQSAWGRFSGED